MKQKVIESILDNCRRYNKNEITEKDFNEYLSTFNVNRRLSMYKKSMMVSLAVTDFEDLEVSSGIESDTSAEIEVIYVNRFLLSYLDIPNEFYLLDADDIEELYNAGVIDYILETSASDFDILKRMFDNAIKLKYISILHTMINDITSSKNEENVSQIAKIFEDKETISNVSKIMEANDPTLNIIKDVVYSNAKR